MDQDLLDVYAEYLLSSFSYTTATGLSGLLGGAVSHDQITRWLSSRVRTSSDLWRLVKRLVREVETDEAVIIFDDSIEEKPYTDENEIICWHYDHSTDRTVKGINFLTALYRSGGMSLPVAFQLVAKTEPYIDAKSGQAKRRSPVTKNEYYRQMLTVCVHNRLRFRYVLNDNWYASAENMMFVKHQLERDFIMALKSNRKVALSAEDKAAGRFQAVSTLALPEGMLWKVYLESVDFPVLLAKQVFTNDDGSTGILYLVTSDVTLDYTCLTTIYQARWKVEEYHRSLKQNASLAKSPTRTVVTQTNHFFAALCAYIKLERLRSGATPNHYALKSKLYVAALHSAFEQLRALQPFRFASLEATA